MRNNRANIKVILIISIVLLCVGCSSSKINIDNKADKESMKLAVVFTEAGLGDKSFNDLCYEGVLEAQEKLGIEFDYIEAKSKNLYDKIYMDYAKTGEYDLIIGLGGEQEDAVRKISKLYPNQKISLIDSKINVKNVSAIYTKWNEQTFLNGVLAGLCITEDKDANKTVGVILGKNLSYLNEGAVGFEAGVKYINPEINVIKATVDDFSNPSKAKEIALLMYKKGANYIQQLAGESGFGVFAAAEEMDKYVFGVDANQNTYEPDYIVSTATRYANKIIYDEIYALVNNTWEEGVKEKGLKDDVIGYERKGSNVEISKNIIDKVENIKELIIDKKIEIPSTSEELEKKYI